MQRRCATPTPPFSVRQGTRSAARLRWRARSTMLVLLVLLCMPRTADALTPVTIPHAGFDSPPRTPKGLDRCYAPIQAVDAASSAPSFRRLRYEVEILGINLGSIDLRTQSSRRNFDTPETEYRATVKPRRFIGGILHFEGKMASVVPGNSVTPTHSVVEYEFRSDRYHEDQRYTADGTIEGRRKKNGKLKNYQREMRGPVTDLLTGFNLMRNLGSLRQGCAVVVNDGRAYTVWVQRQAVETVEVRGKRRQARRYLLRYGADRGKPKVGTIELWVGNDAQRLVYKARALHGISPELNLQSWSK